MDSDSETILFRDETPSEAYEHLTDAVYSARFHDNYVQINIDKIPRGKNIGVAEYDENKESVTDLELENWVLDLFGVRADEP